MTIQNVNENQQFSEKTLLQTLYSAFNAMARAVNRLIKKTEEIISVKDFGAKGDGTTDDGGAIEQAFAYALQYGLAVFFPAGSYLVAGGRQFVLTTSINIRGDGSSQTTLTFTGSPTKVVRTRAVWRSEYDSGNFASNSDSAIGCAFVFTNAAAKSVIGGLTIHAQAPTTVFSTPFDSTTDYPWSDYDVGLLIQCTDVRGDDLRITGVWADAGCRLDPTTPSSGTDRCKFYNSRFEGHFGLKLEGPKGETISGNDREDMTSSDTRGSSGSSDFLAISCQILGVEQVLTIDGVNKRVRSSTDGGALSVDGQNGTNSAKRFQGIRFIDCRIASPDPYILFVNYVNRLEFYACHTEFRSGYYDTDGVTTLVAGDFAGAGLFTEENHTNLLIVGGEKSGEPDNIVRRRTSDDVQITEVSGWHDGIADARLWRAAASDDVFDWTPVVTSSGGDATHTIQYGTGVKHGSQVTLWGRVDITRGSLSGAVSISGLPFACSNRDNVYDPAVVIGLDSNITYTGTLKGVLSNNTTAFALIITTGGGAVASATHTAISTSTTGRIDFMLTYLTDAN